MHFASEHGCEYPPHQSEQGSHKALEELSLANENKNRHKREEEQAQGHPPHALRLKPPRHYETGAPRVCYLKNCLGYGQKSANFAQLRLESFLQTGGNVLVLQTEVVGTLVVDFRLMEGVGADFVGLSANVKRLGVVRLRLQNEVEGLLSGSLLVEQDVALRRQQVAVLHLPVHCRQVQFQVRGRRLIRVEAVQRLCQLLHAVKVVVFLI